MAAKLRTTVEQRRVTSAAALLMLMQVGTSGAGTAAASEPAGTADTPYPDMPEIAPIGARIGRYLPVPEDAKGTAVDPAKGYRLEEVGRGLYMITDNAYQSMFMVYETGVVVIDAPPPYAAHIMEVIREVTPKPISPHLQSLARGSHCRR